VSSLFQELVAPERQLPGRVRPARVATPHNLPGLIPFGSVSPKATGHSMFTGGQVAHPQAGLTHPQAPESFTPPSYGQQGNATAPTIAPLTARGGAATAPTLPFGPTGATTSGSGAMQPPRPAPTPGSLATLLGSGHLQAPTEMDAIAGSANPPTGHGPNVGGYTNTASVLATLLSQAGQKLNPSAGGGGTRRIPI
jgi:hypothetical protein